MNRHQVFLATTAILVCAALSWAGPQARVGGVVLDSAGNPIPTATINVTSPDQDSFEKSAEVHANGTFKMLILDATRRYVFHVIAPGSLEQEELGQTVRFEGRIEEDGANGLGHRCSAGLPGHHHCPADGPQPISQQSDLGALAGALAALERDETTF
jgi:hypothetical protein